MGHVRVTHPFPSVLDGIVAAAAALLAGGGVDVAVRLGVSMVLLQASVGSLNDVIDAPRDAGRKPGKPIPGGLVQPVTARLIAVAAAIAGLALALPSGAPTVALAAVLLALGYWYDLRLKGTAWSWLPFALAIPLFPTYGWLGAAGSLPPIWAVLLPTAMLAGAALAIGNAAVDVERDRDAGAGSVALALGQERAWRVQGALLVAVFAIAIASLVGAGTGWGPVLALSVPAVVAAAGAVRLSSPTAGRREQGWKLEAVGVGLLAILWLAAAVAGRLTAP